VTHRRRLVRHEDRLQPPRTIAHYKDGRPAGEEFLIILQAPSVDALTTAAERLRQCVAELEIQHPDNEPSHVVTISLGAVLLTSIDLGRTNDEWFARADAALYQAKEGGRNRLELAAA